VTDGILSGRGRGRDQFGRDKGTLLTQFNTQAKIGIPLASGKRSPR
jgi:hypothetical protein